MCEFCSFDGRSPCCVCRRGYRPVSPWGDYARRILSYLAEFGGFAVLAFLAYLALTAARGAP